MNLVSWLNRDVTEEIKKFIACRPKLKVEFEYDPNNVWLYVFHFYETKPPIPTIIFWQISDVYFRSARVADLKKFLNDSNMTVCSLSDTVLLYRRDTGYSISPNYSISLSLWVEKKDEDVIKTTLSEAIKFYSYQ